MVEGEDGISEDRRAFSIFDGPEPDVRLFKNEGSESRGLADWLADQIAAQKTLQEADRPTG